VVAECWSRHQDDIAVSLTLKNLGVGRYSSRIFIGDGHRKRIESDMIAGPAWPLEGQVFYAAISTASAST
jgi:hypothetical protein